MTVYCGHELIQNCDGDHEPTFNVPTTLDFDKNGAPGAFGMLNLDGGNGTPGAKEEGDWILHGFDKYLPLGKYRSDPGAKFESSNVGDALDARIGTVLLFPVFKTLEGQGRTPIRIIGWIGFHLDSWSTPRPYRSAAGPLHGIHRPGNPGRARRIGTLNSWGVKSIQLIE